MTRIAIDRRTLFGLGALAIAGRPLAAGAIDVAAAIVPIQRLTDALLAIMRAGRATPFEQRFAQLAPVIDNAFDLYVLAELGRAHLADAAAGSEIAAAGSVPALHHCQVR